MHHQGYLQQTTDDRQMIKAFGPELVIQQLAPNRWLFGFSQTHILFELDETGQLITQHPVQHDVDAPKDTDIQRHQDAVFTLLNGHQQSFAKMNRLAFSYDHDMAFYTHFTVTPTGKLVFATTPLGGFVRAAGYHRATYVIHDWASKKPIAKGYYAFPEGSLVYFEDGRTVVFELDNSGDFRMKQIKLKGS